jgi:hypothetical protein
MSSSTSSSERRRFLALLACFLAALFVFDRGLSLAVRTIEQRSYGKSDFEQRLGRYLAGRNPAVLVFGTSRTFEGIIPAHLESCLGKKIFKEAYWGKGPKYNYYFYRLYKKRAGVPKLVIYGVDYFIYNAESNIRWMSRFNLEEKAAGFDVLAGPLLLFKNKKHNDEFFNNLMTDLGRTAPAADSSGDEDLFDKINTHPGAPSPDDNPRLRTERPPQFFKQRFPKPPGKEGDYFLRLLDELKADGVKVALVSLPDYIGSLRTNWQMPGFHRHLQDLSRRYENVTLLAYNTPRDFDLDKPELFLDGGYGKTNSHLSQRGAAVLGRKLCRDLAPLSR